jgi:hypothetical protein
MLALTSVWIALLCLALSLTMLIYRPAFGDLALTLVLYFGTPGSLCLALLVLWTHRRDQSPAPPVTAQRLQARVAVALSLTAIAITYGLVIFAQRVPRVEP